MERSRIQDQMGSYQVSWFVARLAQHPQPEDGIEPGQESDRVDVSCQPGLLSAWIQHSHSTSVATNSEVGVSIVLHGEVYDPSPSCDAEGLLDSYLRDGLRIAHSLVGSFALLVVDRRLGGLVVITDRVNSRKVFMSEVDGGWWLSTSLYRHPREGQRLDPAGIAAVLACGAAHGRLTPFEGVRVLEPASVHMFTERGYHSDSYWDWQLGEEFAPVREPEGRADLVGLLRSSVERRLPAGDGIVFVSLSGGYDSRSIAGFLAEAIDDRDRLRTFTYHHGADVGDTDSATAALAANALGLQHQTVEGYEGDLLSVLAANSSFGQGIANFCTEVDVWNSLGPVMAESDQNRLFVGDRFFVDPPRSTANSALLAQADVFPASTIDWFLEGIDSPEATALWDGWQAIYGGLLAEIPLSQDPFDLLHRLGFDHYISDNLMLWRESFQMPYVRVASPYLDNEVLDFMMRVPGQLRRTLYREAVASAFPNRSRLPAVHGGWNSPDWSRELRHHTPAIREAVTSVPSQLDELIAPDVILRLLETATGIPATGSDEVAATLRRIAKRSTFVRRFVRAVKPRVQHAVPTRRARHRVLLDLLTLRGFLAGRPPRPGDTGSRLGSAGRL